MSDMRKVPLCIPHVADEEIAAVAEVLRSGWMAHGPKNHEFEDLFCQYLDVPHAITLNSCTSALFLALVANDIRGEVILPSFTWVASANAVLTAGAQCVFADVDYATAMLDPDAVEAAITPQTEALMVVHFGGLTAQMDRLQAIAERHQLLLIEDSAEAIGASLNGTKTGGWGIGCFSFFPTKNITTGEGGMLTTRDESLAAKVRALSAHGICSTTFAREKQERPWLRAASYAGYNFRLSNLLAAIGVEQMKKLDAMNEARRSHAARYDDLLSEEHFELPPVPKGYRHVYQMYTVRVRKADRTRLLDGLKKAGVGASVHFDPPVHRQPCYTEAGFAELSLPETDRVAERIVTLPMYPGMTEDDVAYVAEAANRLAAEYSSAK